MIDNLIQHPVAMLLVIGDNGHPQTGIIPYVMPIHLGDGYIEFVGNAALNPVIGP